MLQSLQEAVLPDEDYLDPEIGRIVDGLGAAVRRGAMEALLVIIQG